MKKIKSKFGIVPIFIVLAIIIALTISSEGDKKINIVLDYSSATNYDDNDDGKETTKGIIDLTVEKTEFNWELNKNNLLTRWTIENLDDKTKTELCYGNEDGCSFINLISNSKQWDDILYLNYGKDSIGYNNKVTAQVIYYDVDLSIPISEIYYSGESEKEARFYEKDPEIISNMEVNIENKDGDKIGHYEIIEKNEGYDLVLSNKETRRKIFSIAKSNFQESKVVIENIQEAGEVQAVIDKPTEQEIKTDIIAVDDTNLKFENAEITLTKYGPVNKIVRCENFNFETKECLDWEETNISFVDDGSTIRFNVTGFSAYGGADITIINIQSYPQLYGNWTVKFTTEGMADLIIRPFNGTTWTNTEDIGSGYDLKFLEVKCGDNILPYEWVNESVIVRNYSCSLVGYETQKELTTGHHYLEFLFGLDEAKAYNDVGPISVTSSTVEKGGTVDATSSGTCGTWSITSGSAYCSLSSSSCTATITGIAVGSCTIKVVNLTGDGQYNISINVVDTTAPTNDMTISAIDYPMDQWGNGILISWTESSANDTYNYTLRRAINSPSGGSIIYTTTSVSEGSYNYSDRTTSNDSDNVYYYGIFACDNIGNCNTGVWSDEVSINAQPIQNSTTIKFLDGRDANGSIVLTTDDLKCVGIAYDRDLEEVQMLYNITILETYGRGSTTTLNGIASDCIYFDQNTNGWQSQYNFPAGTTYCTVLIDDSLTSEGDKIDCMMTPYDGKEYGDGVSSATVYINNSRPNASNVYISPTSPNESATLSCNYTFNDIDTDSENVSAALFRWYINNEGLNDFIEIPGETSRTLSSYFDKDDSVMCAVKVKDIDIGWLNNSLYDDDYVNSSTVTIRDNAKPQIINFSDNSNQTNPTTTGQNVTFNAQWVDYEDPGETAQIYVCSNNLEAEIPDETGTSNLTIGAGNSTIFYTNLTGQYVETIGIKPNAYINSTSGLISANSSTGFIYDIYAFEVDNIGDPIPSFNINNMSTYPIAEDHNNAFINGRWNYIRLQFNSQPLVGKRLAIVFCIDNNDENHIYCSNDISTGNETLYIRASSTSSNYNVNITNRSGAYKGSYSNASIMINYASTSNGEVMSNGCIGKEYCHTEMSTTGSVSCNYNVPDTDTEGQNTYYIKACDDGGQCSVWRQGDIWVNYKAYMTWVNLTTTNNTGLGYLNFSDDSNLNCTHDSGSDSWNKTAITFSYKWFVNRGGSYSVFDAAPTENIVTHGNTQEGDIWICQVTPNDGFSDGTPMNSSARYIGVNSSSAGSTDGTPVITNVIDNSNSTNPTSEGNTITFNVYWSDSNSTQINRVYICNSTSVTTSGCSNYQFGAQTSATNSNPVSISFTAQSAWLENQTAYVYVYDNTWIRSTVYIENFTINHRPNTTVTPSIEYISSTSLRCNYQFNNSLDSGDTENTSLTTFRWWMDGSLQSGRTTQNITGITTTSHTWVCGVKVYDQHGLSSSDYINSSNFYGTNTIIAPILWSLSEAVGSNNRTENNASTINIIGYINRSNVNITALTIKNDEIKINSISNGSVNATLLGTGYSYADYAKNNSYITISSSYQSNFSVGSFIEFANHNRTYFFRYNITSKTDLMDGRYWVNINPNLESAVSANELLSVYDLEKPSGWFNLTLNLFAGSNEVKVRGYENVSSTVWLTGLFTTVNVFYDNETPVINVSSVPTSSNENSYNITFSITDNFKINLSTLLINITNGTYNVTHRYDSTVYTNSSWNWGNNINCSGNNTNKNCTVLLSLNNGNYTIFFSVNDTVNNNYSTSISNYLVDSTKPVAPTVYAKSIQNTTNLSVLWRDSSANITNVQYAVGESRYPSAGWTSIVGWTNSTDNVSNKLIDSNNDLYPDSTEAIITSSDYNLSSNDIVFRNGSASLKRFTNGTFMFNCTDGSLTYLPNCTIVQDVVSDGIYKVSDDLIIGTNFSLINGSRLLNFTNNITYSDYDYDDLFDSGEAVILDNNTNLLLDTGYLNGSGIDKVLVNATLSQLYNPLTTSSLSLENHHFYYVSVQYKTNENLFYSITGSSLSIKYKVSSGGGGANESVNCTGPIAVAVTAPLVSETRTINASWSASTDNCYAIDRYEYAIGTAKYNSSGWSSITSWANNSLNRTAIVTGALQDGRVYYWNVRAVNVIGQISAVNYSDGTTYYDQIAPVINSWTIQNSTNISGVLYDKLEDNMTIINLYGDENMSCFVSPYDKGYLSYDSSVDRLCNVTTTPAINLSCNVSNLSQGSYTYYAVCQDTSTPVSNKHTSENNYALSFNIDFKDAPTLQNFGIWIYYSNMTLKGSASNLSNTTFTDEVLLCNGSFYDLDNDTLVNGTLTWKINSSVTINTTTITQSSISSYLNLSKAGNGSKSENITCFYNITDSGATSNNSIGNYTVHINNTKPVMTNITINSSSILNRTNDTLGCYATASDLDNDLITNYTFIWYKNLAASLSINTNLSYNLLGHGNTSKGENWSCSAVPYDGEENGTAMNSSSILILNSAPYSNSSIPNITLNIGTSTTVTLNNYFADADSDTLTYNFTTATNITVSIDQGTSIATITPDSTFVGSRTIQFNATDNENASSGYGNLITINITNSTINVNLNSPTNYYNSSNRTITFNCSANNTVNYNLSNATLSIWLNSILNITNITNVTGGNSSTAMFNITTIADGTYTWNCQFIDNRSEQGQASSSYTFTVDTAYPTYAFGTNTLANASNSSNNWIFINLSFSESVKNITWNINGTLVNYTNQTSFYNATGLSEGNYTYNASFCDFAGNCNSTSVRTIIIDLTNPTAVGSLTNTSINDSSVTLNWTFATDANTGIAGYKIYRNGTLITTTNSSTTNYTDTGLNGGSNYLYNVSSLDYAGNENRTSNLSIITLADTTAPIISSITNSSTSSTITVNWTTDDSSNSTVYWSTNSSNLSNLQTSSSFVKNHSITVSSLSASTVYYYNVSSCNSAGYCNVSETYNITTAAATIVTTSGSSGGGGGSSSTTTTNKVSLSSTFTGYNVKKNDILEFTFKDKTYSLKITSVGTTTIDCLVVQTSQKFTIGIGETTQIDLNGDLKNDIELKLVSIVNKVANLLIRSLGEPKKLAIIQTPQKTEPSTQPVTTPQQPPKTTLTPVKPEDDGTNPMPYAIAGLLALALVSGLVMKEKMRMNYIYNQPELRLHEFVKKAKLKGHKIADIRKALVSNGWPGHMVDAVALHETINALLSKGHNHKTVREELKKKGFAHKVINDALMHHYITSEIGSRRSIKKIRQELIEAGWDKKIVDKKLPLN